METIAKIIYLFFIWLDRKIGKYESFDYETAPYCGHSYDGHNGYFTKSHFHESDGGGETKGWFHRYILGVWYSNVDGKEYGFHVPFRIWLRYAYYEIKRVLKYSAVKIQYPYGKRTLYIHRIHFRSFLSSRKGYYPKQVGTLHIIRLYGWVPCSHNTILL
jgi:hypothetical protein